jgi:hypothetical protein
MWDKFKKTFADSEVIWWARIQVAVGAAWYALSQTDLSPLLNGKYLTWWLILNGFVTEVLRRRRAEYDKDGNIK